ncbi:MAG: DNA translocase FtsK [Candidatus Saccharimonadales bacterium]
MAAKNKKQTKKKRARLNDVADKSPFGSIALATFLCLLALFFLIGSFGTGGPLPVDLFHGAYMVFGWAAYLVAVALFYWGIIMFTSEDHHISSPKLAGMSGILLFSSSLLYVSFANKNAFGVWQGGHGGGIGHVLGSGAFVVLDKIPAVILFVVLTLLALFFAFGITPKIIMNLFSLFKRHGDNDEENDLAALKSKTEASGFKLNEGVPIVHHETARVAGLKNTTQKLLPTTQQEALTTASDPDWKFPGINLLDQSQDKADAGNVNANAAVIRDTLANFNIEVEMEGANVGPRLTQYTLKPPSGIKLGRINALDNNLALDLAAHSIRIEAPIPGKRAVGIEVPNLKSATVRLSSIFVSQEWQALNSPLSIAIGKDIAGIPIVADLDIMPHLLIAGQTGSGKSVMINTVLTSLLYRNSPSDLKLILVDPKQVELKPYDDIPHLLAPVITEPEKCISALKWATLEMERRYRALVEVHKRNIGEYNTLKQGEGMPYIVIVIDELADLMMVANRDVESLIVRIAQKARAVGIHLVLATQRPSVDVITGLIKANFPARIAFTTASQVDSRTIIDQVGAEKLLGQGDMLLLTADMAKPKRVQGAFIGEEETAKVTDFIRMQRPPQYNDEVVSQPVVLNGRGSVVADYGTSDANDGMFKDAVHCVIESHKASTSLLQRRLRIGYGRAARLIEAMEEQGIVGPADGSRPREVLVSSMDTVFGNDDIIDEADNLPEIE